MDASAYLNDIDSLSTDNCISNNTSNASFENLANYNNCNSWGVLNGLLCQGSSLIFLLIILYFFSNQYYTNYLMNSNSNMACCNSKLLCQLVSCCCGNNN